MEMRTDALAETQPGLWRTRWRLLAARIKNLLPFAAGIAAAFLALLLYSFFFPAAQPLTVKEVNETIAQAMASATPAPAYSAQVFQVVQPSLVLIQTKNPHGDGEPGDGLGSGVVVSEDGLILTALHVVRDATEIELTFADGFQSSAQIVVAQPENDIAVLAPDQLPDLLVPAVLGNPNAMRIGDEAFAVGNPFGLYGSMSAGVISGFNRSFHSESSDVWIEGLIQMDSAVNPGNSGGPLLNRYGQVVGIVIGILNPTEDDFFIGIGFAVPITIAGGAASAPQY